jgi:hypothetical protein
MIDLLVLRRGVLVGAEAVYQPLSESYSVFVSNPSSLSMIHIIEIKQPTKIHRMTTTLHFCIEVNTVYMKHFSLKVDLSTSP